MNNKTKIIKEILREYYPLYENLENILTNLFYLRLKGYYKI